MGLEENGREMRQDDVQDLRCGWIEIFDFFMMRRGDVVSLS